MIFNNVINGLYKSEFRLFPILESLSEQAFVTIELLDCNQHLVCTNYVSRGHSAIT